MGIIDNDIYGCDVIIGYYIVIDIVVFLIDKVRDIVDVFECIFLVEVMGCYVGFLGVSVVFVGVVNYVILFELFIDLELVLNDI